MKKSLLALAVGLMATASSMDAAKVYFENTKNWDAVYSYAYESDSGEPNDASPFTQLTSEVISGKTLYVRDTGSKKMVIFLNKSSWDGQTQTGNLKAEEGNVYNADSQLIGKIVNGTFTAIDPGDIPAPDLYLRGGMNGWNPTADYKFTKQDDGTYTLTTTIAGATSGTLFKIASDDWNLSYGSPDNDNMITVEAGGSYTLTPKPQIGDNGNLVTYTGLTDVTFTFNPETYALTVSDAGSDDPQDLKWFAAWDIDGTWVFGNELEKQEEGTYKIHLNIPANTQQTNYFAIFQGLTNTSFSNGNRYYPMGSEELAVENNKEYQISTVNNDKCWTIGNGNWTIVIDPTNPSKVMLSFELGDSTGEANVLIDRVADTQYDGIYESYALTPVEGKEHVYTYTGSLNSGDKLKFNIQGKDYYYDPSIGTILTDDFDADDTLTIDYPLTEGEGDVIFNYTSNVVITVDVPNEKVTVDIADAPRVAMYVTNGEESKVIRVVRQENTRVYKVQYEAKAGDQIDFRLLNVRYECEFDSPASTEANGDKVYNLIVPNDEKTAPEFTLEPGVYNFTINANANNATTAADETKTLTLSKVGEPTPDPDPEPTYDNEFYVRGNIFGVTSWSDEKMTYTDGKFVLANKTVVTGAFGIKEVDPTITEGDNQVHWYSAANAADADVVLDKVIDLKINGSNLNLYAGTYTFTFDPEALTLTVVGTQTEFPQEGFDGWTVTLAGNHNEFNSTDPNYTANVSEDGKAQLSIIGLNAESGFKFVVNKPNETWYGITDPIEFGKKLTLGDTGMSNSVIPNANPKYKYTFDVDLSSKPYTVVITQDTSTGISEISLDAEDAVFFNLQGVKVEKPENGLYIVVRNGKSQKVMVK